MAPWPPGFAGPVAESQEITQPGNKGRKTPISFNSRKYVESTATARSECTARHKNKTSYNTDYIIPDLIGFFGDD